MFTAVVTAIAIVAVTHHIYRVTYIILAYLLPPVGQLSYIYG